jgi:hypothetical protein
MWDSWSPPRLLMATPPSSSVSVGR